MENKIVIVKVEKRTEEATVLQKALTDFGCNIKVRLGLHDVPADVCSPAGLIILEVVGDDSVIESFCSKLNDLTSVTAKYIKM